MAQQIQTVPAAGAQFLFPAVSRSHAAGESYAPLAIRASLIIGGMSLLLALPVALFSHLILSLWVGKDIADAASATLTLLAAGFAILGLNVGPHFVLLGTDRARFVAGINIVAGIVATGVGLYLVPQFALTGAAWARVSYALITLGNIGAMIDTLGGAPLKSEKA